MARIERWTVEVLRYGDGDGIATSRARSGLGHRLPELASRDPAAVPRSAARQR